MVDIPFLVLVFISSITLVLPLIAYIFRTSFPSAFVLWLGSVVWLLIFLTTDQIAMGTVVEEIILTADDRLEVYNVTSNTGSGASFNNSNEARTIEATSTSILINQPIECIELQLRKIGSPPATPDIKFGTFDGSGNLVKSFGNVTIASLNNSFLPYTRCLPDGELYFIQSGDRIGYRWIDPIGSDASNAIETRLDVNNPFDGTATRQSRYSTSWTSDTGIDMQGILYRGENSILENNILGCDCYPIRDDITFEPTTIGILFIMLSLTYMMIGVLAERGT